MQQAKSQRVQSEAEKNQMIEQAHKDRETFMQAKEKEIDILKQTLKTEEQMTK